MQKLRFIGIGAQKSATTAMHFFLQQHPEISMGVRKEIHYFDRDDDRFKAPINYEKYHNFFPDMAEKSVIRGEITPSYLYWRATPKRIYQYNPNIKLIVVLRNPILRAYSHWNMEVKRGNESSSFLGAIRQEISELDSNPGFQHLQRSYLARGFYIQQLRRYLQLFPRKNILIIKQEDFSASKMFDVFRFLGCKETIHLKNEFIFAGQYTEEINLHTYQYLRDIYRSSILKLEKELNWDCRDWLHFNEAIAKRNILEKDTVLS